MVSPVLPDRLETRVMAYEEVRIGFDLPESESGPEKAVLVADPETGKAWGYVVVDNTARGPSLGGIRIAPDVTLSEVFLLARAMTLKSAAADLPLGGGKSGILGDPEMYARNPGLKRDLIRVFAEALWSVTDYIPGPDMGTDEQDMETIYQTYARLNGGPRHGRGGAGRPADKGGLPLDEWGLTAHGLFSAAQAAQESEPTFRIEGSRVIVQGYGNVGSHIARKLHAAGAVIVGASDIHAALYHPDGLDVDELCAIRKSETGLYAYSGPTQMRLGQETLDDLLCMPCDMLVPAARPHVITAQNADKVQARLVLEGANGPVSPSIESYLEKQRGITCLTDFIVNPGGVIACAVEVMMDKSPEYQKEVMASDGTGRAYLEALIQETVAANVNEVYDRIVVGGDRSCTWREAAMILAQQKLAAPGT